MKNLFLLSGLCAAFFFASGPHAGLASTGLGFGEKVLKLDDEIETPKEPILDVDGNQFDLAEILDRHKGKLIYLDVWASWCGPCRSQMPASKELHKAYGDRVVFLYLSLDKQPDAWKKAHAEEGFEKEYSFIIPNITTSNLVKELEITGIPRYILYDAAGKLVETRAARPSTPQVKEMFDKYLKQNN
jgi:thiol-disulfide isomerase/thioredoxin